MFGSIGGLELVVLAIIGLIVFGPKKLPEVGRSVAKGILQLRRAANEMRAAIEEETGAGEIRETAQDLRRTIRRESERLREAAALDREIAQPAAPGASTGESARPAAPGSPTGEIAQPAAPAAATADEGEAKEAARERGSGSEA